MAGRCEMESTPSHRDLLSRIADGIAALRAEYPQLAEFDPDRHRDLESLRIAYGYRTHRPTHRGGWTAGVPNPDDDGVWFHIDLHDADSTAQVHTQPAVAPLHCGETRVTFLILEGARTRKLAGVLREILIECGVRGFRVAPEAPP
jgi:hypothetical protein